MKWLIAGITTFLITLTFVLLLNVLGAENNEVAAYECKYYYTTWYERTSACGGCRESIDPLGWVSGTVRTEYRGYRNACTGQTFQKTPTGNWYCGAC